MAPHLLSLRIFESIARPYRAFRFLDDGDRPEVTPHALRNAELCPERFPLRPSSCEPCTSRSRPSWFKIAICDHSNSKMPRSRRTTLRCLLLAWALITGKVSKLVEAGGVEPPSEKPYARKPTRLSRSLTAFASGPLERARTNRRLALSGRPDLARDPQAAGPKPARWMTPLSAPRAETEETRYLN